MYVRACKLYEDAGRALPRHRLAMLRPLDQGWLVYRECYDQEHKRIMMMARLLGEPGRPDVYPELRDAVMMVAENGVMTIRGLERNPVTRQLTAMAWYCEVLRPGKRGHVDDPVGPTPV